MANDSNLVSKLLNVSVMKRSALILAIMLAACGAETDMTVVAQSKEQSLVSDNSTPGPKTTDPKAPSITIVPKPVDSPRTGGDVQLPQDPIPVFESKTAPQPGPVVRPFVGGIPVGQS